MIDKNKLKELHDTIKNHPYWISFDKSQVSDLIKLFSKMDNIIYEDYHNTFKHTYGKDWSVKLYDEPYYPLFTTLCHDFRASLWRLKSDPCSELHEKGITYLQMFLQVVHCYIDGIDVPRFPVGDNVLITTKNLDNKYHIVFIRKRSAKPDLIKTYRRYQETSYDKEVWEKLIKEVEEESSVTELWED